MYGRNAISRKQMAVWCEKLDSGKTSLEDEHFSGRPVTESIDNTRKRIENLLFANRRIKIRAIADELALTKFIVVCIVQDDLKFSKVCARYVPKQISLGYRNKLFTSSSNNLPRYVSEENFLENIIRYDETWGTLQYPETKR